jgi:phage baseplate assembly protein gpV
VTSPILRGLDLETVPYLLGYNGTSPKAAARIALLTPRGDPLLATWQYGLGRSVAWTSDLSGRWAENWLAWPDFARFAGQLVNWSLPRPGDEQLDLSVSTGSSQALLTAAIGDQNAAPVEVTAHLLTPDGETIEVELRPSSAHRYQASVPLPGEGVYLAQVTAYAGNAAGNKTPLASQTTGLVVPYSAEYAHLAADMTLLADLTTATGGQTLSEPAQAFTHNLAIGRQTHPIWPVLLLLAALLFPFDVALRRLRLGRREWQQAQDWLKVRLPGRQAAPTARLEPPSPSVRAFRQAQERTRRQPVAPPPVTPPARPGAPPATSSPPPATPPSPTPPPSDEGDTLARLRAAKKRARR